MRASLLIGYVLLRFRRSIVATRSRRQITSIVDREAEWHRCLLTMYRPPMSRLFPRAFALRVTRDHKVLRLG